jgi:DNA-binding NarL/FixJ family response regulator
MKSALIVDDHPVVRAAIRIVLQLEGFKLIFEASSGNEVVPLIREHKPQLVYSTCDCLHSTGWRCWHGSRPMIWIAGS